MIQTLTAPWRRLRLGPKLIASFLVVGTLPMAALGVLSVQQTSAALRADAEQAVSEIAFNTADKLDRNLFERYGDVQAFASNDRARSMEPGAITELMDTMMGIYTPIYTAMVVADKGGRIIAANTVDLEGKPLATEGLIGLDVRTEAWFKTAASGSLKAGETLVEDLH